MSERTNPTEGQPEAAKSKTTIGSLKERKSLYFVACHALVLSWLEGKIGTDAPTTEEERSLISVASKSEGMGRAEDYPKEELEQTIKHIKDKGGLGHLQIAATHRYWIRWTHQFLEICDVKFSGDMSEQAMKHDLSKFSPQEILGYGIMFGGGGQIGFRKLEDPEEEQEWKSALEHHYESNEHHPEYFSPKNEEGKRETKVKILGRDKAELYLEESLIDMLASRGERSLKEDEAISVQKWLNMEGQGKYLERYNDEDKQWVLKKLDEWRDKALKCLHDPEKDDLFKDLFGGKKVEP